MTTERNRRRRKSDRQPYWSYRCKHGKDANGRAGIEFCSQSIAAAPLDAQVWAHVIQLAEDEEVSAKALAHWHADAGKHLARQKAARATAAAVLAEATAETARLVVAIARETDERLLERLRVLWHEAEAHEAQASEALDRLDARLARDMAAQQYSDLQTWAREWRGRIREANHAEQRQSLHRLGLRVFVAPAESPHLVGRTARGLPGGEERKFVVVLGWPQDIRQAFPWTVTPLVPGGEEAYVAEYSPASEDDHSEVVRLVPAEDVGEPSAETYTIGGVPGWHKVIGGGKHPGESLGEQLGEVIQSDAGTAVNAQNTGTSDGPITSQSTG